MYENNPVIQRKKDGFNGQKAIVLPHKIVKSCDETSLVDQLFITDIGFYPKAKFHYRERYVGVPQNILIYCINGKGWVDLERKNYSVGPGQFLIIPANVVHKYGSKEQDPWSIYWLHFKGSAAGNFAHLLSKQNTQFISNINFSEERIRLFNTIYETLENGYSADNLGYINMCLWHFLSSFCYPDVFQIPFNKIEKDAIDISIDFMQDNLDQMLTLQRLAAEVHISPSHYSALFKKKTGHPPLEYFKHIKIQKACQYLQFTNLQVREIAYKLGIDDHFYFSRFFSGVMGQSPLEYRKRKQ
jgi:AraC-like DNA-binding protein